MDDDVFVYLTELPSNVHEVVTPCLDGYTVYINSNLTRERQVKAYMHALYHVNNNDFEKSDVQEIETDAHKKQ